MLCSPDEFAFYRAVRLLPDLPGPRLAYADWLDERGEVDRAEFIRLGCWKNGLKVRVPGQELTERAAELLERNLDAWHRPMTDPARADAGPVHIGAPREFDHSPESPLSVRCWRGDRRVYVVARRGRRNYWAVLDYDRGLVARARFFGLAQFRALTPEVVLFAPCADYGLMDKGDAEWLFLLREPDGPRLFYRNRLGDALFDRLGGGLRSPCDSQARFDPPGSVAKARAALGRAMTFAAWLVLKGELTL